MNEESIVVLQQGDGEPEIFRELEAAEVSRLVGERDAGAGEKLRAAEQRRGAVGEEVMRNPDLAVEYYILQYQRSRADQVAHERLAELHTDKHVEEVENFRRITEMGSCLLYRDIDYRGSTRFCTITWPNLSWSPYNFNDAASSVRGWGVNILFEHSWYGGRRMYVVGLPYVQFPDLREFGFNDLVTSVICP